MVTSPERCMMRVQDMRYTQAAISCRFRGSKVELETIIQDMMAWGVAKASKNWDPLTVCQLSSHPDCAFSEGNRRLYCLKQYMERKGKHEVQVPVRRFPAMSLAEMIDQVRFWSDNIYNAGDTLQARNRRRCVRNCITVAAQSEFINLQHRPHLAKSMTVQRKTPEERPRAPGWIPGSPGHRQRRQTRACSRRAMTKSGSLLAHLLPRRCRSSTNKAPRRASLLTWRFLVPDR